MSIPRIDGIIYYNQHLYVNQTPAVLSDLSEDAIIEKVEEQILLIQNSFLKCDLMKITPILIGLCRKELASINIDQWTNLPSYVTQLLRNFLIGLTLEQRCFLLIVLSPDQNFYSEFETALQISTKEIQCYSILNQYKKEINLHALIQLLNDEDKEERALNHQFFSFLIECQIHGFLVEYNFICTHWNLLKSHFRPFIKKFVSMSNFTNLKTIDSTLTLLTNLVSLFNAIVKKNSDSFDKNNAFLKHIHPAFVFEFISQIDQTQFTFLNQSIQDLYNPSYKIDLESLSLFYLTIKLHNNDANFNLVKLSRLIKVLPRCDRDICKNIYRILLPNNVHINFENKLMLIDVIKTKKSQGLDYSFLIPLLIKDVKLQQQFHILINKHIEIKINKFMIFVLKCFYVQFKKENLNTRCAHDFFEIFTQVNYRKFKDFLVFLSLEHVSINLKEKIEWLKLHAIIFTDLKVSSEDLIELSDRLSLSHSSISRANDFNAFAQLSSFFTHSQLQGRNLDIDVQKSLQNLVVSFIATHQPVFLSLSIKLGLALLSSDTLMNTIKKNSSLLLAPFLEVVKTLKLNKQYAILFLGLQYKVVDMNDLEIFNFSMQADIIFLSASVPVKNSLQNRTLLSFLIKEDLEMSLIDKVNWAKFFYTLNHSEFLITESQFSEVLEHIRFYLISNRLSKTTFEKLINFCETCYPMKADDQRVTVLKRNAGNLKDAFEILSENVINQLSDGKYKVKLPIKSYRMNEVQQFMSQYQKSS